MTAKRSSSSDAREALDAIRLALEASTDPWSALAVIQTICDEGPPVVRSDTRSVARLISAVRHTRAARFVLT